MKLKNNYSVKIFLTAQMFLMGRQCVLPFDGLLVMQEDLLLYPIVGEGAGGVGQTYRKG